MGRNGEMAKWIDPKPPGEWIGIIPNLLDSLIPISSNHAISIVFWLVVDLPI